MSAFDTTPFFVVKQVISPNSSRIAENIRNRFEQLAGEGGGTIALYDANHNQSQDRISFIQKGIDEARRKGWIKGPIEVWFKDKAMSTQSVVSNKNALTRW